MAEIKKVKQRIYNFDFTKSELKDGEEIITSRQGSEFVNAFKKRDLDKGIMVTPGGYKKGLVYKSSHGGEVYNNPQWLPDIVSFSLNIFGVKKNCFYKLTVIGRDTYKSIMDVTQDRTIQIYTDNQELLMNNDFAGIEDNTEYSAIFKANSNEINLFFRIGKIYLNNVIIDEVELFSEVVEEEEQVKSVEFAEGKMQIAAYGIFTTQPTQDTRLYQGRYLSMDRITGKGLNLYFDRNTNEYILERDNIEDILNESFTNINYLVDFNFNKVVNKGQFSQYNISDISSDISPNTLKQGYLKFEFIDDHGNAVQYSGKEGRLAIIIYKLF